MAAALKTCFAGIPLENPFLLASAPPTTNPEGIARAFEAGWGGAVIKTVQYTPRAIKRNVTPRIRAVKIGGKIAGFTNFEIGSPKTLDQWAEGIRWLKERFPERAVIASLLHTDVLIEEEWREVTRIFDQAGADAFELNLSCSHGQAESGCGAALGGNAEMVEKIVAWICGETVKPVLPKLTALTSDVPGKGLAAKRGGAAGIVAINTISSLPGVDLDRFVPYNNIDGQSAFQGMSGHLLKPVALRCVAQLAEATHLPISATGGIYTWQDAAEFILLGASSLQVCSAVMENGYGVVEPMKGGLLRYMEEKHFSSIEDFCGLALGRIGKQNALRRDLRGYAQVRPEPCTGCGKCSVVCRDNGYGAISVQQKKAVVDRSRCDGCGLCAQICPAAAIDFAEQKGTLCREQA